MGCQEDGAIVANFDGLQDRKKRGKIALMNVSGRLAGDHSGRS
jgi:hypothetical protein